MNIKLRWLGNLSVLRIGLGALLILLPVLLMAQAQGQTYIKSWDVTVVAIPSYIPIEYIIYFLPTTAAALAIFIRLGFKWQPLENINQILTYVLCLQVSLSGFCIVTFLFLYCAKKL